MAIFDENGVPVLHRLSPESAEYVRTKGAEAVEALEQASKAAEAHPLHVDAEAKPHKAVQALHDAVAEHLLLGEVVVVHNKTPVGGSAITDGDSVVADPSGPDRTTVVLGAQNLDQALKTVVGALDAHLLTNDHADPPDWVASTSEDLARLLAEQWGAEVRDIAEVFA